MNFLFFLLFGAGIFALSFIGHKNYHNTTLYALAIGGVVNANYFHSGNYPIHCFGLPFGIDSLIYTLFVFCVIVMLLNDSKKSAYLLAISSIIAILFSALMELSARVLAGEAFLPSLKIFDSFMISAFSSVAAIVAAVEIVNRLKRKYSQYVCMAVGIAVATLVNSGIYYPASSLVRGVADNMWIYVGTSFAGKGIALVYSLLAQKVLNILKKKA